jgi:hypothetical protein
MIAIPWAQPSSALIIIAQLLWQHAARSMQCSNNSTINHLLQPQTKTATAFFICHHGHDMTRQQTTINNRKNIMKLI